MVALASQHRGSWVSWTDLPAIGGSTLSQYSMTVKGGCLGITKAFMMGVLNVSKGNYTPFITFLCQKHSELPPS